jgi:hypothetical protein
MTPAFILNEPSPLSYVPVGILTIRRRLRTSVYEIRASAQPQKRDFGDLSQRAEMWPSGETREF